ncbi:MAG: hypothetical protein KF831_03425 [Acidobacteria bacterium]|nr:hypothetical protein [Acidobacteriota bacterium]
MSTKTIVIRPSIFAGLGLALAFLLFSEPARAANVCTVGSNDQVNIFGAYKFTNLTSTSAGVNSKISDPDSKTAKPEGPYLSKADLESVMKWIAVQVGAKKSPYCYKQSSPRGAGVPLSTCPEGTEKNGLLCYPQCREGFTGNGPVCWQTECPEGFNDIGAFCQKPAAYGRGAGYALWDEQKCNNENEQGCEKWGALWYPKCRDGFKPFGANICSPSCPEGYSDTGTGCAKPSYGRGAGQPMECREGLEKDAGLCYRPCSENQTGVGPVCWDKCPSHVPVSCGAGCAADQKTCASITTSQVLSVAQASLSLASMGAGAGAAKNLDRMESIVGELGDLADRADGSVPVMLGQDGNFDVTKLTPMGGSYTGVVKRVQESLFNYATLFSDDFETLTTPEVAATINQKFSAGAAEQIKKEWGMRHLTMLLKANGFQAAQDLLYLVSFGDPTGLASVAEAFTKPQCDAETPFPSVTELR